jgi:hypothetical protein
MFTGGPESLLPFGILSPPSPEKAIQSSKESVKFSDPANLANRQHLHRLTSAIPAVNKSDEEFIEHRSPGPAPGERDLD